MEQTECSECAEKDKRIAELTSALEDLGNVAESAASELKQAVSATDKVF